MLNARTKLDLNDVQQPVGRPFSILVVAWSPRAAERLVRDVAPLLAARGDVEIIFTHPGDSLMGIRVDLIIIGRQNPNMSPMERDWFENVLELRRHPNCGWLDLS